MTAATAQARGRISEIELAIIQIGQDMRSEVAGELREIEARAAELEERKIAAEQSLRQIDIGAPQAGRVHQLTVHTVGGVIAPDESIMQIVPSADALVLEARVSPQDIDQISLKQPAILRLPAFSREDTTEIAGEVGSHFGRPDRRSQIGNIVLYASDRAAGQGCSARQHARTQGQSHLMLPNQVGAMV